MDRVVFGSNSDPNARNCSLVVEIEKKQKDEKKVSIYARRKRKATFLLEASKMVKP